MMCTIFYSFVVTPVSINQETLAEADGDINLDVIIRSV